MYDIEIQNSNCEKLLGIKIGSKLNFKEHLDGIIKKTKRKVNALFHIASYMNVAIRKLLINSFIASEFNHCLLVWMRHHRSVNNKVNLLFERRLRIVYSDSEISFEDLLDKDRTVQIHIKNVQSLSIEMFNISKNYTVPIVNKIF